MQNVLRQIVGAGELKKFFPLLDEGCVAASEHFHDEMFAPEVMHWALVGKCAVFSVAEGEGVCVCSIEQGILYVNVLYLRVGAGKGLMRKVGKELVELAKGKELLEVRFKTQRPAGMKRLLGDLGYRPRCVEFALTVSDNEEKADGQ